jgi:sugar phosphate permease
MNIILTRSFPLGVARKRWLWKLTIGLVLIVGYAGYYVCRSNLSVASPSLIKDLDLSKSTFGAPHTSSFMKNPPSCVARDL